MFEHEFRISELIARHMQGSLSAKEQAELDMWLNSSADRRKFFNEFQDEEVLNEKIKTFYAIDKAELWDMTREKIKTSGADYKIGTKKQLWYKITAAAAIIMVLSLGLYFYKNKPDHSLKSSISLTKQDIAPGTSSATLTLANGKKIILSDAANGELAKEADIVISKTADGRVVYKVNSASQTQTGQFNTLSTAKGETYKMQLPDGTSIWLNAATTIKYPASFSAMKFRKIELEGEAYFEVAKDKTKPFIVSTRPGSNGAGQEIKVLGTHFNISAYADERSYITTLLEGSIKITNSGTAESKILKPGEQAVLNQQIQVSNANTEAAMAWKNDVFYFADEPIQDVMRILSRWYNVDVVYKQPIPKIGFWGQISRNKKLSEVLEVLEVTNGVHFKIEGRRVIVMM